MKSLDENIKESIACKIPFVLYRKPNENTNYSVFQKENNSYNLTDSQNSGFIFAPFDDFEQSLFIPYSKAEVETFELEELVEDPFKEKINLDSFKEKEAHLDLIKKGIAYIKNSDAKKIVLSRKEVLKRTNFDIVEVYQRLLKNYPTAFVYCWFHPISGLWMGATPERLLSVCNNEFRVMALASTQEYKDTLHVEWGEKELQEHQFVVDYIVSKFKNKQLKISDAYTVKAGNLLHLRADISGVISENSSFSTLIKSLHPTPATCGLPKEIAKDFILKNEHYNREYYTGYLGEIGNDSSDLFVNLRCMKIDKSKNEVILFIGGGITKDSISKNEWLETVAKSMVMKKVL